MAKSGLIYVKDDKEHEFLHSGSRMENGVVSITKILHFRVPEGENPRDYNDLDVYAHTNFPQKYSAMTEDARYKFYGSASVQKDLADSCWFHASCEFASGDPNATDDDGYAVTSETPPWKLKPDNIQFTHPEIVMPFEFSYDDKGNQFSTGKGFDYKATKPVRNSAGDKIVAETAVRNLQMSFSYAVRNWDLLEGINVGNTVNSEEVKICGLTIATGKALLLTPEVSYIKVYEDNSSKVKWEYWSVNISIQIDLSNKLLVRKILNVGDRALFPALTYKDDLLTKGVELKEENVSSQICHFRRAKKMNYQIEGTKNVYLPLGDPFYCGWNQYLAIRQAYMTESITLQKAGTISSTYDCQCEQLSQMPLIGSGDNNGQLDLEAIEGKKGYDVATFNEFPIKSWRHLNIPSKGIKW